MSSPFASWLGTNYCPSDEEILDIRTLLIEPKSRLKRLDDKIADLQKTIDSLTEEHASVRSFVDAHDALLSPVRRLPLDIIQEIFVACLPTHRNCVMSAVEAPLLLGRICSAWRAISLSTPRLWARLHIVEPGCHGPAAGVSPSGVLPSSVILEEKVAQRVDAMKTWLSRSGVCPISISLEGVHEAFMMTAAGTFAPSSTHIFLQALISFSSRWQHITMSFVWSLETLDTLFKLTETNVPILSKLHIAQHPEGAPASRPWPSFALFHAPALSNLAFTGSQVDLLELPIQWTNITALSLNGTGVEVPSLDFVIVLEILSKCPQIQTCRFELPYPEDLPLSLDMTVIELAHLRSLDIIGWLDGITDILRRLLVPALRDLGLKGTMSALDPTLPSHFAAFLARPQRLESLSISTQIFEKTSLLELLHNLPATVTRLCLLNDRHMHEIFDDDALAVLTPSPSPGSLSADTSLKDVSCPTLQELKIFGSAFPTDEALVCFITARMEAEPPGSRTLTQVEIQFSRAMEFDIRPRIQPFLDRGLSLRTTYPRPRTIEMFSPWHGQ
ncbi:hypothetical protein C8F04DRAFT_1042753 [Mycena alexandri]|uniref:F-box domain-containing protein n=1 Tax=Mycena alexandri TaxID=1745969 RepID=A0AAD6SLK9_9AGAR|nr:hypothetical protein C8F04DRAFT_1042753 [Mycena alexandri]